MKKKGIVIGVIAVVAVAAVIGIGSKASKGSFTEEVVKTRDLTTYYSFDGNISPADSQNVLSKSTLSVKTFFVKEGDYVNAGDVLFELDNATIQNSLDSAAATLEIAKINYNSATGASRDTQLNQAEASLAAAQLNFDNAQKALERTQPLFEAGAVSKADLEQAQTAFDNASINLNTAQAALDNLNQSLANGAATAAEQVKQAEAQKASLERQLEDTRVKAEVSGEVVEIHVTENESVTMGTPILDIINYDTLEVDIKIDEYDLKAVEEGKEAIVHISALDQDVPATVTKISREATVEGGVSYFPSTVTLDTGEGLRMGMTVEVKILNANAPGATTVTMKALQLDGDNKPFVYVRGSGDKPEPKYVEIGINDGIYVEILSGLAPDDVVLVPVTMTMTPFGPMSE